MAVNKIDHNQIIENLKEKIFAPVYFLMGEEPYYIDLVRDYIENDILSETEKEFNLDVVYGADTSLRAVLVMAREAPLGSDLRIIIVKEAQNLKDLECLTAYLEKPTTSTILVLAYMGKADGRSKYISSITKSGGVLFESKPIYENQLPTFIQNYFKAHKQKIDSDAVQLMADYLGADLHKVVNEADKLMISIPKDGSSISADRVKQYVGISKQYNVFEFKNAIISRNVYKTNLIAKYFAQNPKANPIMPILSLLFNFFSNLILYSYLPDKSPSSVAAMLKVSPYSVNDFVTAKNNYSGSQMMNIISQIRRTDAASKGIDNASASQGDLLTELVCHILMD